MLRQRCFSSSVVLLLILWSCGFEEQESFCSAFVFSEPRIVRSSLSASTIGEDPLKQQQKEQQRKEEPQRSLYEILGATPNESRSDLKRKYVTLAKQSHPDALLYIDNNNNNNIEDTTTEPTDFNEIATAWRILSDEKQRKRYDRSLQAARISEDISRWAGNWTEQARPAADFSVELLERVAFPFLRRTTATTLAGFQAAAEDIAKQKSQTDGKAWSLTAAMAAAGRAGRAVDKMELIEKAQELEGRAVLEYKEAVELQTKLKQMAEERLKLSLHTANSGITSAEAMIILEDFNRTAHKTMWDRTWLRSRVEDHVSELQMVEDCFMEAQRIDTRSQDAYRDSVRERLAANDALEYAERQEEAARVAYEQAQPRTLERRAALQNIDLTLYTAEAQAKKSSYEIERRSVDVENQSEKVRSALKHKEKASVMLDRKNRTQTSPRLAIADSVTDQENEERLNRLEELRQEERLLADQSTQLEVKAARLLSRANKLKMRAQEQE
jgi:curved DNA-binding protein CbpA